MTDLKNKDRKLVMYHGQAEKDFFAEVPDITERIIQTTLKQIQAAYEDDLLSDLLLEGQEAY